MGQAWITAVPPSVASCQCPVSSSSVAVAWLAPPTASSGEGGAGLSRQASPPPRSLPGSRPPSSLCLLPEEVTDGPVIWFHSLDWSNTCPPPLGHEGLIPNHTRSQRQIQAHMQMRQGGGGRETGLQPHRTARQRPPCSGHRPWKASSSPSSNHPNLPSFHFIEMTNSLLLQ
jgi:hypothetical protein